MVAVSLRGPWNLKTTHQGGAAPHLATTAAKSQKLTSAAQMQMHCTYFHTDKQ